MAAKTCTNCGSAIPDGAAFCPSCGAKAPEAAPAEQPAASFAPPGSHVPPPVTPEEAQAAGQPAAAQVAEQELQAAAAEQSAAAQVAAPQPAPAQTAPQAVAPAPTAQAPVTAAAPGGVTAPAPGGFGSPTPGGSKTNGKTMAIAGGVAAVVLVGAAFMFMGGKDEPVAPQPANNGGQNDPVDPGPAPDPVDPDPVDPPPNSGSVADLLRDTVGSATLSEVVQAPDIAANLGANDAYSFTYAEADGALIGGSILAFGSGDGALGGLDQMVGSLQASYGYQVAQTVDITDANGNYLGTGVNLVGESEIWIWTNDVVLMWAESGPGYPSAFFDNWLAGT